MKTHIILLLFTLSFCSGITAQTADKLPLRLKIGSYNVGHFNQGELGGYQGDNAVDELQRWRHWISQQSLDIFIVNEWNKAFDKDSVFDATKELLKPFYTGIYFGDANKWIFNGIATNLRLTNLRQVNWFKDYYAIIGDLKIGKKTVTIMSTHIPWQKEGHELAINSMINEMKKYEYVICGGDFNAFDQTQLRFASEGFNSANGGNQGWHCTAPANVERGRTDGLHIDNIVTSSNIKIMNVSAPEVELTKHDHWPIIADLIITW